MKKTINRKVVRYIVRGSQPNATSILFMHTAVTRSKYYWKMKY